METLTALTLRVRIAQLRDEIAMTNTAYQFAREKRQPDLIVSLLRKRSDLTRQLFQTQGELLLLYRSEAGIELVGDRPFAGARDELVCAPANC